MRYPATVDYTNRLKSSDWFVGPCDPAVARRMVAEFHYAGGASNTSVDIHGLYRESDMRLFGVAWWLPPTKNAANSFLPPGENCPPRRSALLAAMTHKNICSLSRLVLRPDAPKNAATFLMSRSVRLLADRWRCLCTYADTMQGHTGRIYKAAGWEYLGMTEPQPAYRHNGKLICRKSANVTLGHAAMLAKGYEFLGAFPKHRFRLVRDIRVKAEAVQPELFS